MLRSRQSNIKEGDKTGTTNFFKNWYNHYIIQTVHHQTQILRYMYRVHEKNE